MARKVMDKAALRREILDIRSIIQQAEKNDCNESETRRRIERIFESLMGYDVFKHLSREHAVRGSGETEHVDFSIQMEEGQDAKSEIMVEIKRVCIDLAPKHLKQVSSYAIDAGCEWILLTNGREWRVYHVAFGQPPITKLVTSWNVLTDEVKVLWQTVLNLSPSRAFGREHWHSSGIKQMYCTLATYWRPSCRRDL